MMDRFERFRRWPLSRQSSRASANERSRMELERGGILFGDRRKICLGRSRPRTAGRPAAG